MNVTILKSGAAIFPSLCGTRKGALRVIFILYHFQIAPPRPATHACSRRSVQEANVHNQRNLFLFANVVVCRSGVEIVYEVLLVKSKPRAFLVIRLIMRGFWGAA